jgi:tetratricopeptide (TPR) repeat protein
MRSFIGQQSDENHVLEQEALFVSIDGVRSRACILEESKDHDAAVRVWQEYLRRHPEDAEAINELGITLIGAGRFREGLDSFRQALKIRPDFISAKTNAGVALRRLAKIPEALLQFQEVLKVTPEDAVACFNLGTTLHLAGQYDEARIWLQKSLELCPSHTDSAIELGKVLEKLDRIEEAIQAYHRAIHLRPDCIAALLNLAVLLQKSERFDQATTLLQKVVGLRPNDCDSWLWLGAALRGAGRYADALSAYRRALSIQPGSTVAYCNMALTLQHLGRFDEAIESCKKALSIEPSPAVTFNMGTMLLRLGNFREGWQAYKSRYAMDGERWLREEARAAPWVGEAVAGRSILILGEQGSGDHIQFARYLPALSELGANAFYLAPKRLHRLFSTLEGSITLLSEIPGNSRFDFQCPLMHLPAIFEALDLPLPNQMPYLAAEPERVVHWRSRIGDHGFRIGIVWQGNRYERNDERAYPLAALRPLAGIPGVRLISLQINCGTEQLEDLPSDMNVERLGQDFDSGEHGFIDAAAAIEVVDLVVSCDTSVVHVAGALGRPVWVALNLIPEWRWQLHRSDSIWYPSVTLFRQKARGDWDGVFSRMAEALLQIKTVSLKNVTGPGPRVEVSWGELLDKISILNTKAKRMTSPASITNVRAELAHLNAIVSRLRPFPLEVDERCLNLRSVNEELWDVENALRACEKDQQFDAHFVELSRKVYKLNDKRAKIKQEINALMKSRFVEEKEHSSKSAAS